MKKSLSISLAVILFIVLIIWVSLSNFEFGKYDNFQEAIEKGIPNKVNNIIHTEKYDGVTIVMYTTNPDKDEMPFADYEALAVAFFKGTDGEGWDNIGHHGWTHYENENMTVYIEPLRVYDNKGNSLHEFYVAYGEVNNAEIVTVETRNKKEKTFEEAEIITKHGKRYYFQIGKELIVRGLSKKGEVIDRQGG
ncbi:hypothetical protein CR203_24820 [Salipaludibacillus neizhouensis]|uniref:Uncharacterized protein n=1 Tax=Salipaludibacillus neizhouensis TaxID=885475 RepID=A0A3A9K1C8_9BACI|nr:hypothetical protein [Salipaludibacillus neizhouensis]RKL64710.1 hypothetical protein CR203_24820 [Salipaludibacillus neizhouensis]